MKATAADRNGVYSADVLMDVVGDGKNYLAKTNGGGRSTFFPDSWSEEQLHAEIASAYANSGIKQEGPWSGKSLSGVTIKGRIENGVITQAYPVMEP